ncbi:MAG: M13-type metalloendopeptidase [Pseudomonadota bacterium]
MKNLFLAGAALIALAACGGEPTDGAADADPKTETQQTPAPSVEPTGPELGVFGVATNEIDDAVKPGDDFYQHVNGKWLDSFQIPDEFSSYGSFTVLFERSEERVRKIIEAAASGESAPGSVEQKIGDFFSSFTDTDAINEKGLSPLADDLAAINGAATHEDIARLMVRPDLALTSFLGAWVDVDSKNPSRYIVYLTQSGLGMPNRDYYLEEKFADKREAYKKYIEEILALAEIPDAAAKSQAIFDLEAAMAETHWEPAKRRNRDLTYNLKTRDELAAFAPNAPWNVIFEAAGLGEQTEFILREDDALQKLAAIFEETPIATWKDYLTFHLISDNAAILPTAIDDAQFAFYGTELRGQPKKRERWKRGVAAVNGALGEAVGEVYVEKHFPASSKSQMEDLVANLRAALDQRLDTLPWMSDTTKEEAHRKLGKFTPKIGYPEKWTDYSDFEVVRGDAYGNAKRANAFEWTEQISKLGQPIDRTEWFMTPQTVNAYYSPNRNEIVFPAAILQAPFFDPAADPAVNYGAIGAVIGHEIGHGFDDQGRKSDGDGVLRDWWTSEDARNFQKLADTLGAQFATYEPIDGFPIDPDLTMGENIGDVGGMAMAYHAYKLSLNGAEAQVIDGFTGDQRFFMAWAQVWKRVVREEQLKNQIASDPHSPARYRVNGVVRNMDAWYDAFAIGEDDALYLAPEKRVKIW